MFPPSPPNKGRPGWCACRADGHQITERVFWRIELFTDRQRWHVCWNSNRRILFINCLPRKTNFRFPFAANKRKFALSANRVAVFAQFRIRLPKHGEIDIGTWKHGGKETRRHRLWYMETHHIENGKRKPRRFSLISWPFAHRTNGSFYLYICWRRSKRKLSICQRTTLTWPSI